MSEGQWKARGGEDGDQPHHHHHHPYEPHQLGPHYGTFPGVPSHQSPAMGFPQQVAPTGVTSHPPFPGPTYYPHGYQAVHGYVAVAEGRPLREPRLPCYGIGIGWLLFITGFFLAAIPWYVGAFILLCVRRVDYREKPGYVACTIGAFLAAIAIIVGATKGADIW